MITGGGGSSFGGTSTCEVEGWGNSEYFPSAPGRETTSPMIEHVVLAFKYQLELQSANDLFLFAKVIPNFSVLHTVCEPREQFSLINPRS